MTARDSTTARALTAVLASGAIALFLAACGGQDSANVAAPAPTATSATSTPEPTPVVTNALGDEIGDFNTEAPVDLSGSVTTEDGRFVEYPDGFRIDFTGVTAPGSNASGEDGQTDVIVSLTYSNSGTEVIDTHLMGVGTERLLYGVNGESAVVYGGGDELPARLSPGTSETRTIINSVPVSAIGQPMEYTVSPDVSLYTDFTFLDLDKLLTR